MNTEEYYKANLSIGSMLRRISDGRYFEVASMKEIKMNGNPQMEYILQAESGSKLPSDSHWIDCYFTIVKTGGKEMNAQSDYMARVKLVSANYTRAKAKVDRARKAHNQAPCTKSYAKYIAALAESEQAAKEYYS